MTLFRFAFPLLALLAGLAGSGAGAPSAAGSSPIAPEQVAGSTFGIVTDRRSGIVSMKAYFSPDREGWLVTRDADGTVWTHRIRLWRAGRGNRLCFWATIDNDRDDSGRLVPWFCWRFMPNRTILYEDERWRIIEKTPGNGIQDFAHRYRNRVERLFGGVPDRPLLRLPAGSEHGDRPTPASRGPDQRPPDRPSRER